MSRGVELERGDIERSDFPAARRGYDQAAVDAHLRSIADAVQTLKAAPARGGMASVAAERVEAIVAAAEASARDIEERARADAEATRERAEADGAAHVKRAAEVADRLSGQAAELQQQISGLVGQIAGLKAKVESIGVPPAPQPAKASAPAKSSEPEPEPEPIPAPEPEQVPLQAVPDPDPEPAPRAPEGARLIALNMALSGTPREETARYLRENYHLEDEDALLDDVYLKAGG